jgi:hypothetical protein
MLEPAVRNQAARGQWTCSQSIATVGLALRANLLAPGGARLRVNTKFLRLSRRRLFRNWVRIRSRLCERTVRLMFYFDRRIRNGRAIRTRDMLWRCGGRVLSPDGRTATFVAAINGTGLGSRISGLKGPSATNRTEAPGDLRIHGPVKRGAVGPARSISGRTWRGVLWNLSVRQNQRCGKATNKATCRHDL